MKLFKRFDKSECCKILREAYITFGKSYLGNYDEFNGFYCIIEIPIKYKSKYFCVVDNYEKVGICHKRLGFFYRFKDFKKFNYITVNYPIEGKNE